jgi:hypothetical protein
MVNQAAILSEGVLWDRHELNGSGPLGVGVSD